MVLKMVRTLYLYKALLFFKKSYVQSLEERDNGQMMVVAAMAMMVVVGATATSKAAALDGHVRATSSIRGTAVHQERGHHRGNSFSLRLFLSSTYADLFLARVHLVTCTSVAF